MSRDEVDQGLPLFAGYQRFYGVLEPDDEQNRLFFARFAEPSRDGLLLGAWDDRALVGFACLYWTFSSVSAARIALLSDLFVTECPRPRARRGAGRGGSGCDPAPSPEPARVVHGARQRNRTACLRRDRGSAIDVDRVRDPHRWRSEWLMRSTSGSDEWGIY